MQTTPGLIVCVVVPIILLVGYDILRRKLSEKNQTDDVDALRAELEQLRQAAAMQNAECRMQNEETNDFKPLQEEKQGEDDAENES